MIIMRSLIRAIGTTALITGFALLTSTEAAASDVRPGSTSTVQGANGFLVGNNTITSTNVPVQIPIGDIAALGMARGNKTD